MLLPVPEEIQVFSELWGVTRGVAEVHTGPLFEAEKLQGGYPQVSLQGEGAVVAPHGLLEGF